MTQNNQNPEQNRQPKDQQNQPNPQDQKQQAQQQRNEDETDENEQETNDDLQNSRKRESNVGEDEREERKLQPKASPETDKMKNNPANPGQQQQGGNRPAAGR